MPAKDTHNAFVRDTVRSLDAIEERDEVQFAIIGSYPLAYAEEFAEALREFMSAARSYGHIESAKSFVPTATIMDLSND